MNSYLKLLKQQAETFRARSAEIAIEATEAAATAADPNESRRTRRDAAYTAKAREKLARAVGNEARKREDILAMDDKEPDQ